MVVCMTIIIIIIVVVFEIMIIYLINILNSFYFFLRALAQSRTNFFYSYHIFIMTTNKIIVF